METIQNLISWSEFEKIDIRIGTIINVLPFENAKKPAYQIHIDFGELGIKKSSAQLTSLYKKEDLIGKQITAVINFPNKQIANFISECLILGAIDADVVSLLTTDIKMKNGIRVA